MSERLTRTLKNGEVEVTITYPADQDKGILGAMSLAHEAVITEIRGGIEHMLVRRFQEELENL